MRNRSRSATILHWLWYHMESRWLCLWLGWSRLWPPCSILLCGCLCSLLLSLVLPLAFAVATASSAVTVLSDVVIGTPQCYAVLSSIVFSVVNKALISLTEYIFCQGIKGILRFPPVPPLLNSAVCCSYSVRSVQKSFFFICISLRTIQDFICISLRTIQGFAQYT